MKKPTRPHLSFEWRSFAKPLLVAFGFVYLGFHAFHGERGLYALFRESHQQAVLQKQYHEVRRERKALELQVSHLRDRSLDLDLLDEQYRRMMGGVGEGELVVLRAKEVP